MQMNAVILAAGKGTRLNSVINDIPKPMVKVGTKPILEQNIIWLRDNGIRNIYINLHQFPDSIRDYFDTGSNWDTDIKYSYEPELLGTSGAVNKIASDYWSTQSPESAFIVVYGDNILSDFNLAEIIKFHNERKGLATICLFYRDDVSQSGIAVLDDNSRILRFIEKPTPEQCVSHLVNTGIYIMEPEILKYIPSGFSDFGRDIFPCLLEANETLYGIVSDKTVTAIDTPQLLQQAIGKGGSV